MKRHRIIAIALLIAINLAALIVVLASRVDPSDLAPAITLPYRLEPSISIRP